MYFATYTRFGTTFFGFGKILQIFTINMVKKEKILTKTIKAKSFIIDKYTILFLWSWSQFFIFDHAGSENP